MENEDKKIAEIAEVPNSPVSGEEKKECASGFACMLKNKIKCCKNGSCKCAGKGKWIAAAVLVLLIGAGGFYYYKMKKADLGPEVVKTKVEKFINENLVQPGTKVEVKSIAKDKASGLYKMTITVGTQSVDAFATQDGAKFFPQVIEMDAAAKDAAAKEPAAPEKTEAEAKTDVPTVDLFVMSYCPYGLQMEKGVLPAVEALGNKIKFNLKFVDYTLHGPKEVTENVNQYCVQKTQPAKLGAYLKCFWKASTGTSAGCMKTVGINAATIATCVTATTKEFNPTEKAMGLDKEETVKFGVQGSPTLVINGTTVASGRDSASVLKAICSGFTTQPKECQAKLPATSPGAGFDDQAAAAGAGSAPAASCATN